MPEKLFGKLVENCRASASVTSKEKFVQEAAASYRFSCSQLERLVKILKFPTEIISIAQIMAPR
jgi:hypothetical protein